MKISNWKALHGISYYRQEPGRHPASFALPPYYERVELLLAGRGWILHENEWREVLPGDLIWNKPGDNTIGRSDFENPYHCIAVNLAPKKKHGIGVPRFSHWPEMEEVRAFARESVRLFLDEQFDHEALFEAVLGQLLFRVRLHAHEQGRRELPPPLHLVLQKIERDFSLPCRLEELAEIAGWSVAHLHEVFRRHLQTTPHQMLMRMRIRSARERLSSTNEPVKQIAVENGFSDSAAFTHAFKAETGMTPGKYRERALRAVV